MIKKLQLYTICIVIIVIVLSQLSLFDDNKSPDSESEAGAYSQNDQSQEDDSSTYSQPIKDITNTINKIQQTKEKFQDDMNTVKGIMDIQNSLDELKKSLK